MVADLGDGATLHPGGEFAAGFFHRDALHATLALVGVAVDPTHDADEIGTIGKGAPVLVAVDDPVVTIPGGATGHARHIGAGVGF